MNQTANFHTFGVVFSQLIPCYTNMEFDQRLRKSSIKDFAMTRNETVIAIILVSLKGWFNQSIALTESQRHPIHTINHFRLPTAVYASSSACASTLFFSLLFEKLYITYLIPRWLLANAGRIHRADNWRQPF